MAIVDVTYYETVYHGDPAAECDFTRLEARAEDVVGAMTRWQVTEDTIANLPPPIATLYKRALCAQIEALAINGADSLAGEEERGWTVGKVSVSGKSGSEITREGAMSEHVAPMARMFLEQTGLMNPAVPVAGDMPPVGWWL